MDSLTEHQRPHAAPEGTKETVVSNPTQPETSDLAFDAQRFREVLGHYPTGVSAITAMGEDGLPTGLAVGTFTSVSLDPPLVGFLPDKNSSSFPKIRAAGSF